MTHNNNSNANPLLNVSTLKNRAVPFPEIKPSHFLPALSGAIECARAKLKTLREDSNSANFNNTILALETCSEEIDLVSNIFYNMLGANTSDALQALAQDFGPQLSNFSSDIILDSKIFAKVKAVYENRQTLGLTSEESRLLENNYTEFVRNGALLSEKKKQQLREIDQKLSKLSPEFSENVLKATNAFEYWVSSPEQLKGLPESAIEAAAQAAQEKGKAEQWLFTLHAPSIMPFLQYADDRSGREKLWRASNSKAFGDAFDNQKIVLEIVHLKHQRANLLGFKSHADFVLKKRMAESPDKVQAFLVKLLKTYKAAAERDLKMVQDFAKSQGGPSQLQGWDFAYYVEKLKKEKYDFDEEELRPYFSLQNVIAGAFEHAKRLYGLEFKPATGYPIYHSDVQVFEVFDKSKDYIGLFFADFFPRDNKKGGAWMTNFYEQGLFRNEIMRPHVSIVCNFTKPTPSKPSLLTFQEVQTLFHEFGHSLHSLLSKCKFRSLAGTNVYWDFVELPSQILENWTLEKESLDLFAKHFETGEKIPAALTKKIKEVSKFLAGYYGLRQVNFSLLDMAWFDSDPAKITSVPEFERQVTKDSTLLPFIEGTNISCGFSHIFGGGYSAGYYSYKWAEVLDADAFEFFKEKGLFDQEVALRFKDNILSRGGTEHPMDLYKKFRGREPDPDALFRRDGLV